MIDVFLQKKKKKNTILCQKKTLKYVIKSYKCIEIWLLSDVYNLLYYILIIAFISIQNRYYTKNSFVKQAIKAFCFETFYALKAI